MARTAFDKHKDPDISDYELAFVSFIEGFNENSTLANVDLLSSIAKAIAHYVDIYGTHQSGSKLIRINRDEIKLDVGNHCFKDNGNAIYKKDSSFLPPPNQLVWGKISIKQDDIEKALEDIKNYQDN